MYVLLAIIAFGVLMLSSEGKGLLKIIVTLAILGSLGYVAFWILLGGYAVVSANFDSIANLLSWVFGIGIALLLLALVNANFGTYEKLVASISNIWTSLVTFWKKDKLAFILVNGTFVGIVIALFSLLLSFEAGLIILITLGFIVLVIISNALLEKLGKSTFWIKQKKLVKWILIWFAIVILSLIFAFAMFASQ